MIRIGRPPRATPRQRLTRWTRQPAPRWLATLGLAAAYVLTAGQ